MAQVVSGVFPVYENEFTIGGKSVANLENFQLTIDNGIEEWTAMENEGWKSRLMTAKSFKIAFKGKRTIGDQGNDMIAGLKFANGQAAEKVLVWNLPDAQVLTCNCVVNVTNDGGGESTNAAPLEFEMLSNGKPEIT